MNELGDDSGANHNGDGTAISANGTAGGAFASLFDWLRDTVHYTPRSTNGKKWTREELEEPALRRVVEDYYRPEIRRLERALVLNILDAAWKDHLLAMDHLRASVSLRGYAQIDPKVEYKREGMRTFEEMWNSTGERVTDLIFKMEQLDEQFVASTWRESAAIHEEAKPGTEIANQQQQAIDNSDGEQKIEPIRNHGQARRAERTVPLRQRQEVQELLHAQEGRKRRVKRGRNSEVGIIYEETPDDAELPPLEPSRRTRPALRLLSSDFRPPTSDLPQELPAVSYLLNCAYLVLLLLAPLPGCLYQCGAQGKVP